MNQRTLEILTQLRRAFGVETNVEALRRALAIARYACQNCRDDKTITLVGKSEKPFNLALNE